MTRTIHQRQGETALPWPDLRCFAVLLMTFSLYALVLIIASRSVAEASEPQKPAKIHTCKFTAQDIGTLVGRGSTASEAFEDAATQCFDRRELVQRRIKGRTFDEETGLTIIDLCANIRCVASTLR